MFDQSVVKVSSTVKGKCSGRIRFEHFVIEKMESKDSGSSATRLLEFDSFPRHCKLKRNSTFRREASLDLHRLGFRGTILLPDEHLRC